MRIKRYMVAKVYFWPVSILICLLLISLYQTHKPLPEGIAFQSREFPVSEEDITFLYDLTYSDEQAEKQIEQDLFDTMFDLIDCAEHYILIDMFLFNSWSAADANIYRDLSGELTSRLVKRKAAVPGIEIDFLTDPINTVYGGAVSEELQRLEKAGVNVIITDLNRLRDSNFIYSSIWRLFIQWFGNAPSHGLVKHPFSADDAQVTIRSYLRLLNFKANHRKVLVADHNGDMVALVSSANPHGGSSAHSNVGLLIRGGIWKPLYDAEQAVALLSGSRLSAIELPSKSEAGQQYAMLSVLTENKIKQAIINEIENAEVGDQLKFTLFYLSDRDIMRALIEAAARGADIRIIIDPNKDAFGYEKNGVPNRPAAYELFDKSNGSIAIRWYQTQGEQFHSKLFASTRNDTVTVIVGSANLTRRNLDNFNLELCIKLVTHKSSRPAQAIDTYFEKIWTNEEGTFTVDYSVYHEPSVIKKMLYRIQEFYGVGTF